MNNLEIACFLSLYKTRDVSVAADALSITQRVLAQNLKRLEKELGFPLFLKSGQGLSPTLAGRRYHAFFQTGGRDLALAYRAVRGENRDHALCVGWSDWAGCPEWLALSIRRFKADHPEIGVSLRQTSTKLLKTLLYNGELDIALTSHITSGSLKGRIYSTTVWEMPLYLLISRSHPRLGEKPELPELLKLPHITSYLDDDDNEARVVTRCANNYAMLGAPAPEVLVLPNWESVYVEVNLQNGVAFAPANNTVRTHDCFALVPTGRAIPLISLLPLERENSSAELFSRFIAEEAESAHE